MGTNALVSGVRSLKDSLQRNAFSERELIVTTLAECDDVLVDAALICEKSPRFRTEIKGFCDAPESIFISNLCVLYEHEHKHPPREREHTKALLCCEFSGSELAKGLSAGLV